MDSRLRGNDINCSFAVIPAKAGIHTAYPNTNAFARAPVLRASALTSTGSKENTPAEGPQGCVARRNLKDYTSSRHMYPGLSHPPKLASGTAVRPFTYEPTASM